MPLPRRPRRFARIACIVCIAMLAAPACAATAPAPGAVPLPEYPPPAPPRTAPREAPHREPAAPTVHLEGTIWSGADSDGDVYTFEFQSGGKLRYTSPTGTFDSASWAQNGNHVTMEMNGHYADYDGAIEGSRMGGSASNKNGMKWTWTAEKK
jgi:hypothetical protein